MLISISDYFFPLYFLIPGKRHLNGIQLGMAPADMDIGK